jgi:hypothetical protein
MAFKKTTERTVIQLQAITVSDMGAISLASSGRLKIFYEHF